MAQPTPPTDHEAAAAALPFPTIRSIGLGAPFRWISLGFADLRACPVASLFYGFCFTAMGLLVTFVFEHAYQYTSAVSTGFLLLAPFFAMGLYELEALALPDVHLVSDFQLQIEHALDLDGRDLALFIDAGTGTPAPFQFRETGPLAGQAPNSHALPPEAVLQVYADIRHARPPPAFVLCVRGEEFELGGDLSAAARQHLSAARRHLLRCMASADAESWRKLATTDKRVFRV